MRTIIAGSRSIDHMHLLNKTLELVGWNITQVVCGMAKGADTLGYIHAKRKGIAIAEFPADWDLYGNAAGYRRNVEMAKNADACICLWDGKSPGTKHMIDIALKHKLLLLVRTLEHDNSLSI